jgi:hypothetical protein
MRSTASAAQGWITAYHLPSYAPNLNPAEGVWSLLRRSQANMAFADPDHFVGVLRQHLRKIQYRSELINGCRTGTGFDHDSDITP